MAEVVVNGLRFHVQRRRPPAMTEPPLTVVFVHGLGADNLTSLYYAFGGAVAAVGAEVIFYDLRGHGRSQRPPSGYGLRDSVADLQGLLAALGVDRPVHLVGSSYGGMVALAQAIARPEQVAGIVLIDAHLVVEGGDNLMIRNLAGSLRAFDDDDVRSQIGRLPRNQARLARQAGALLRETTLHHDLRAIVPLRPDELRSIRQPVLALYGEWSDLVGVARQMPDLLPDCTVEILPACTHLLLREATAEARRLVVTWLVARMRPPAPAGAAQP